MIKKIIFYLLIFIVLIVISFFILKYFVFSVKSFNEDFEELIEIDLIEKHVESANEYLIYGVLHYNEYISSSGGFEVDLSINVHDIEPLGSIKQSSGMVFKDYIPFKWYLLELYPYELIGYNREKIEKIIGKSIPNDNMLSDYYSVKIKIHGIIFKYHKESVHYYLKRIDARGNYINNYGILLIDDGHIIENKKITFR